MGDEPESHHIHAAGHGHGHADHHGHGHGPARPFTRVRQLLRPERRDVAAVVVFAGVVAILFLASPIAVESLVNTVAFGVLLWPLVVLAAVLMTCLGLAAAIRAAQTYVIECLQRRLFVRVVADYAHRFPRLKLDGLDHSYGPELANRFFDVLNVQKAIATLLLDGVALVVTAVVGMTVLAFYHPFLLGFDVALLLAIAFIVFGLGWGGVRTGLAESHAKYDVEGWLEEVLRCLRAFKFGGGRRLALEKADALAGEYVTARRAHFRVVWRQTLFALGLQVVASTALLGLGGYLVINRQLTLGQLVAAELIVALVVSSAAKLGKYAETFYDLMAGAEKLGVLTDLPLERAGGEPLPAGGGGLAVRVRVGGVAGRARPGGTDWHVAGGERVAVVGPPGSGKTALLETLCGLRDPADGVVEVAGVDLRELSLEALQGQAALVGGPEVFAGTVAENVRLGRSELSAVEVRDALQTAGLLRAVYALPDGLDTPLTPDGGPLSAGQAVRLAVARALAGRPRLLVLDGVLDGLDLRECPDLLPRLFDRAAPWTLLVATNSPAIIGLCDRVVVPGGAEPTGHAHPAE